MSALFMGRCLRGSDHFSFFLWKEAGCKQHRKQPTAATKVAEEAPVAKKASRKKAAAEASTTDEAPAAKKKSRKKAAAADATSDEQPAKKKSRKKATKE